MKVSYERLTIRCSNLLSLAKYIKEYLKSHPKLPVGTRIKIILRSLITSDLILQLKELKSHMGIINFAKPYIMKLPK